MIPKKWNPLAPNCSKLSLSIPTCTLTHDWLIRREARQLCWSSTKVSTRQSVHVKTSATLSRQTGPPSLPDDTARAAWEPRDTRVTGRTGWLSFFRSFLQSRAVYEQFETKTPPGAPLANWLIPHFLSEWSLLIRKTQDIKSLGKRERTSASLATSEEGNTCGVIVTQDVVLSSSSSR